MKPTVEQIFISSRDAESRYYKTRAQKIEEMPEALADYFARGGKIQKIKPDAKGFAFNAKKFAIKVPQE